AVAFEEPRKRARTRERAHQRARTDAIRAPRRHERTHIARLGRGEHLERNLRAVMVGEEAEKLAHVALIRLHGLRRHAPLGGKMREPAPQLRGQVGGGEGEVLTHGHPARAGGSLDTPPIIPCVPLRSSIRVAPAWHSASSTFWCRSRSTTPIRIARRRNWICRSVTSSRCRWGRAKRSAWCGPTMSRCAPACTTGSRTSRRSWITRRCAKSCASSSTGLR